MIIIIILLIFCRAANQIRYFILFLLGANNLYVFVRIKHIAVPYQGFFCWVAHFIITLFLHYLNFPFEDEWEVKIMQEPTLSSYIKLAINYKRKTWDALILLLLMPLLILYMIALY